MSEWSIEHAWKSTPPARAVAHEISPTHSRSTTSHNIDTRRHVLVNHRVDRGFEGVCDTVLIQNLISLPRVSTSTFQYRLDSLRDDACLERARAATTMPFIRVYCTAACSNIG